MKAERISADIAEAVLGLLHKIDGNGAVITDLNTAECYAYATAENIIDMLRPDLADVEPHLHLGRIAEATAENNGHRLGGWQITHTHNRQCDYVSNENMAITAIAHCIKCDAWVQIDTHPQPNGIDIGGPAISTDCPRSGG